MLQHGPRRTKHPGGSHLLTPHTAGVSGRLSGMCQANFETTTQATSAVDAMPAVVAIPLRLP
jgi:hypothetical protein